MHQPILILILILKVLIAPIDLAIFRLARTMGP